MKTCPFCAEEIQDAAKVCKHCGRDLESSSTAQQVTIVQPKRNNGCLAWGVLILATLLFVGWCRSQFRTPTSTSTFSEKSETCGTVTGPTEKDVNRAIGFCERGVAAGLVVGVIANETLLTIKITRDAADQIRRDRLSAEQLIKTWMRGWKELSQSQAVVVNVEWEQVSIATGQTTITGGDEVTVR